MRHHHHHQSLNHEGCLGTTDDFATNFLHFFLFSTALWDLPNSTPVNSLMSSHLFFCLPCLLPTFTVPWKMVLARPDKWKTWPYHCSFHLFTTIRKSLCGPIAYWILTRTSSLVTWSLYEICTILRKHLLSMACILLWSSAVRVHDSQVYRKMDVTRVHISISFHKRANDSGLTFYFFIKWVNNNGLIYLLTLSEMKSLPLFCIGCRFRLFTLLPVFSSDPAWSVCLKQTIKQKIKRELYLWRQQRKEC